MEAERHTARVSVYAKLTNGTGRESCYNNQNSCRNRCHQTATGPNL